MDGQTSVMVLPESVKPLMGSQFRVVIGVTSCKPECTPLPVSHVFLGCFFLACRLGGHWLVMRAASGCWDWCRASVF